MPRRSASQIDALTPPDADGDVLIHPPVESLAAVVDRNHRLRNRNRSLVRIDDALAPVDSADVPVVMTGHQPEFFHPGVWIKHVLTTDLAARIGGEAVFVIVDSDVEADLGIRWPVHDGGGEAAGRANAYSNLADVPFEHLPRRTSNAWRSFFEFVPSEYRSDRGRAMSAFEAGFLKSSRPGDSTSGDAAYVTRWMQGLIAMDRAVGVSPPRFIRVSEMFSSRSAVGGAGMQYVAHLILNAADFADAYNAALAAYRRARGIRGDRHPIPSLTVGRGRIELPLWLVKPSAARQRMYVSPQSDRRIEIVAGGQSCGVVSADRLAADPASTWAEALGDWDVRPRALALTLYLRRFACDLFIHGLGGAKYDQITDEVIRRFLNVEPPGYACVTATLRLVESTDAVTEDDVRAAAHAVRDARWNPQRHLEPSAHDSVIEAAVQERAAAVALSNHLREQSPDRRASRRAAFERIRGASETLLARRPRLLPDAERRAADLQARRIRQRTLESRDYFAGLHELAKLRALREHASNRAAGP